VPLLAPPVPAAAPESLEALTPRQIVAELDRFVIGQGKAKRALAIALRNRWRRQQLPPALAEEVVPKNILLIGPTGVGKTELARRLARLARAPFLKVEASKFTEVGYVGRDCESIVRDLTEIGVALVRDEMRGAVAEAARERAEERLLALLLPTPPPAGPGATPPSPDEMQATRDKLRERLRSGGLDSREVEIDLEESGASSFEMITPQGVEEVGLNLRDMLPGLFARRRREKLKVADARPLLEAEEAEKLIDRQQVAREARRRVEQFGIVFLDELDKVAGRERSQGPEVSREGVQRDLLPIVEGTTVATKYGPVRTDHVLFIAAGAFHVARPSDLIPELQGRFPIRVELESLGEEDFVRILTEPENALTKQYEALLGAEGLRIEFRAEAVAEIARLAAEVNRSAENIGARRLATLLERLLEEVSFNASEMDGVELVVDAPFVRTALSELVQNQDLSRYVL